ncbi:glycoside hydrolase family 2 TIM barrel-domain containing protein [Polaribacter sp. Z022]|uniref:glycoside hydrolase family 2 TIM barrel-domain containing protein n=1 Tax=Polaribacter sp. Z022 TaxID=2927125 RepID=UPI0020217B2E|nr:glycoside hydrolase family 2 TIM barrel-domain containing protein [Polaribacter sp. Z022]MCL7754604.1 DUF4982 domain-containing protein [Polaribacter sp. Z022]
MKKLFSLLLFITTTILIAQNDEVRSRINFNNNWKFNLSNKGEYSKPDYLDEDWRTLNVPHDWSIEQEFSKNNSGRNAWLPGGIGWYRKSVVIAKQDADKEFLIEFDGVYKNSTLWINGHYVGNQNDGYTNFHYNITSFLKFGEKNTFAVKVDNSIQPNCRWYSGSGIYRNVWLVKTNKIAVDQFGTFITTPKISEDIALVNIETTIRNYSNSESISIETVIYNAKGLKVGSVKSNKNLKNRTTTKINQQVTINKPEFWSLQDTKTYSAKSVISKNGKVLDVYNSKFGIRTLEFHPKNGFFLNGENLKLKGVCLHHEAGVLGAAVPIDIWKSRLKTLKSFGCNAIRTAHNPMSKEFLDLCDEMGFLVMNEFVDKWNSDASLVWAPKKHPTFFNPSGFADPFFEFEWQKNYKTTILRDRNHPCVIIWSVGNENHSPGTVEQIEGLRRYTAFVRSLDPTRPVVSGMERGKDGDPSEKIKAIIKTTNEMDLIAMNYGEQWVKEIGLQNPDKPYVSTESYIYFNSTPKKRFANIEKAPWIDVLENNHNMGLFLWVGIDYLGESRNFPKLGSDSGLLDRAGFRKEISYLYEAFWSKKPMVRIAVYDGKADDFSTSGRWGSPPMKSNWNLEKNKKYDLVTYTNCDSVDLYLNGKKIGNKKLKDFSNWIVKWRDVNYKPGTLKAVGIINGKPVCEYVIRTSKKPSSFKFIPKEITTRKIIQVEVNLTDRKGVLVSHIPTKVNFKINGNAKIIGIDNGDVTDASNFNNTKTGIIKNGRCLVLIQVENTKKDISLIAFNNQIKKEKTILKKE